MNQMQVQEPRKVPAAQENSNPQALGGTPHVQGESHRCSIMYVKATYVPTTDHINGSVDNGGNEAETDDKEKK